MININILFPREKRRILEEISNKIKSEYNKDIKSFKFQHVGDDLQTAQNMIKYLYKILQL